MNTQKLQIGHRTVGHHSNLITIHLNYNLLQHQICNDW